MRTLYSVNENYFQSIDTEEKAYWLGFIAADGCLPPLRNGPPRRVTVKLAACDTAHLELLRAAIEYTGPLYFNNSVCKTDPHCHGYAQATLSVGRRRFAEHLVNQGITPQKSLDLQPPNGNVPDALLRHYWRGLFDGDGTIYKSRRARGGAEWTVGIVGAKGMADGFAAFSLSHVGVALSVCKRDNIWWARTSGAQSPQILAKFLYDDATVHLQRKKILVEELLATTPGKRPLVVIGGIAVPVRDCAAGLGLSRVTVSRRLANGIAPEIATSLKRLPPRTGFGKKLTLRGESLTVGEWAAKTGVFVGTIRRRLKQGATPEQAVRPTDPGYQSRKTYRGGASTKSC